MPKKIQNYRIPLSTIKITRFRNTNYLTKGDKLVFSKGLDKSDVNKKTREYILLMKTILVLVNECRIIYVSQTVLSRYMFNVLHLVEEANRHEKWTTHSPVPFIFLSFAVPQDFADFFF